MYLLGWHPGGSGDHLYGSLGTRLMILFICIKQQDEVFKAPSVLAARTESLKKELKIT